MPQGPVRRPPATDAVPRAWPARLLPNLLLSGFMFPFEGMPKPAQYLGEAIPLTHFLRIIRGIVLRGATWPDLAPEVGWMAGIAGALVVASAVRFKKKLG